MKKENYEKATPIMDSLKMLEFFKLPEVEVNKEFNRPEVINKRKLGAVLDFYHKDGWYSPIIRFRKDSLDLIALTENEYNKIKTVFNEVIEARIKDCETKLDKL